MMHTWFECKIRYDKVMQVQAIQVEVIDSRDQIEKSEEDDDEE